ncbi:MAG: histidine phosphatase family protein [Polaromonas sp.]|uniref:histidine phosphatase family protein n=1 Tax=Polaromonas sp. TaxID=1869339 RepID=UPI002734BD99|nr:histidine phosphatase family protein [Polaromonas sp.]MDP2819097.1 histidine phosphatase family protein [Polaromonas sp.]
MKLWLVRHAQVLFPPGTCYGLLDVPAGPEVTLECARDLAAALPAGACISTSPLQRCEHLAQAVIELRPDLVYKTDARLQEMNFGAWEGRPWADIPLGEFEVWTANFADHAVGGHGDSVGAVMARVAQAFDELPQAVDSVWITHAGIIRAAELVANGVRQVSRPDQWPRDGVACGQWRTLELTQ